MSDVRAKRSAGTWWRAPVSGFIALPISVIVGIGLLTMVLTCGYVCPVPFDPIRPIAGKVLNAPSGTHWFGTDISGLDVYSRTIAAGRQDLPLAIIGALASMVVGVGLGLLASGKGRWGERVMRGLDVFQAFPLLVLAIVIVTLTGNRLENVVFAILVINVPRFIRLVRSEALAIRESRYVEAAITVGVSKTRLMLRHVLPNVTPVILVQLSLAAAHALVVIAALSFLGIGVSPPTPSWGAMIQTGSRNMATGQWWVSAFPGLAVFVSVLSFNLVADGLSNRS